MIQILLNLAKLNCLGLVKLSKTVLDMLLTLSFIFHNKITAKGRNMIFNVDRAKFRLVIDIFVHKCGTQLRDCFNSSEFGKQVPTITVSGSNFPSHLQNRKNGRRMRTARWLRKAEFYSLTWLLSLPRYPIPTAVVVPPVPLLIKAGLASLACLVCLDCSKMGPIQAMKVRMAKAFFP